VDAAMIAKTVPDYRERTFYLSGPRSLVAGFEEVLGNIGIPKSRIKTDAGRGANRRPYEGCARD